MFFSLEYTCLCMFVVHTMGKLHACTHKHVLSLTHIHHHTYTYKHTNKQTGRAGRVLRDTQGGFVYRRRNEGLTKQPDSDDVVSLEAVNLKEKELFLQGAKLIAIISEAASAGISLHADRCVFLGGGRGEKGGGGEVLWGVFDGDWGDGVCVGMGGCCVVGFHVHVYIAYLCISYIVCRISHTHRRFTNDRRRVHFTLEYVACMCTWCMYYCVLTSKHTGEPQYTHLFHLLPHIHTNTITQSHTHTQSHVYILQTHTITIPQAPLVSRACYSTTRS